MGPGGGGFRRDHRMEGRAPLPGRGGRGNPPPITEISTLFRCILAAIPRERAFRTKTEVTALSSFPRLLCVRVFIPILLTAFFSQSSIAQLKSPAVNFATDATVFRALASQQRLERGRYLVEGVAHCFECHAEHDFKKGLGQPKPGTKGAGEIVKNEELRGVAVAEGPTHPNLTPDQT